MIEKAFHIWHKSTGRPRVVLFITAIIGKVALYAVKPPYFRTPDNVGLPFPALLILETAGVVFTSIIVIEVMRIVFARATSGWSVKRHLLILSILFAALFAFRWFVVFPNLSIQYYEQGWSLTEKRDYQCAALFLDYAVGFDSQNIKAHMERAFVRRELGDLNSALHDYNRVIALDPEHAGAFEGRGYVYYYQNDKARALKDWNKAMALDPESLTRVRKWIRAIENK